MWTRQGIKNPGTGEPSIEVRRDILIMFSILIILNKSPPPPPPGHHNSLAQSRSRSRSKSRSRSRPNRYGYWQGYTVRFTGWPSRGFQAGQLGCTWKRCWQYSTNVFKFIGGVGTLTLTLVKYGYLYQSHTTYSICVNFRFFFDFRKGNPRFSGGPFVKWYWNARIDIDIDIDMDMIVKP